MAKDESTAADKWNEQTLDSLMAILQADLPRRRDVCICDEVLFHINKRLPLLLSSSNSVDADPSKIQAVKHLTESYIVLSELREKSLENVNNIRHLSLLYPGYFELAGFNQTNLTVEMERDVAIIRVADQEQYPIGSFELLVSVKDDIDGNQADFQCVDGFLSIKCPIRKYVKKRFGGPAKADN
ncbi:unnamed protein product [Adineta ricciae]|uniref:Uncharacterized protein n=1 Tax=Adineta ricciae TaxID=249248 RepID=A0A816H3P9_ADIRI|nr:unnamed protein product [Adineta ricciae]